MVRERDNLNRRDLCLGNWVLSGLFPGLPVLDLLRDDLGTCALVGQLWITFGMKLFGKGVVLVN